MLFIGAAGDDDVVFCVKLNGNAFAEGVYGTFEGRVNGDTVLNKAFADFGLGDGGDAVGGDAGGGDVVRAKLSGEDNSVF